MDETSKLKSELPSDREIRWIRAFDAPRQVIFDAWTRPDLLKQWLFGPDDWRLAHCETDFREGGSLRFEWQGPGGGMMGMGGVYREIVAPDRIVHTELFDDDWTGGETVVTNEFTEKNGKTTNVLTVLYSSKEARDGARAMCTDEAMAMTYDRLDALLESMPAG